MKGREAMTSQERVREHRAQRAESGWKQINVWLSPEARLCLKEIKARMKVTGEKATQSEIICQALLRGGG